MASGVAGTRGHIIGAAAGVDEPTRLEVESPTWCNVIGAAGEHHDLEE